MAYVPAYMGNSSNFAIPENMEAHSEDPSEQEKYDSVLHVNQVEELPVKIRASGLWDFMITVQSSHGGLQRISSLNHPV